METLFHPVACMLSRFTLKQKLVLLSVIVLSPLLLLGYRYIQLSAIADKQEPLVFLGLSVVLISYLFMGFYFSGRTVQGRISEVMQVTNSGVAGQCDLSDLGQGEYAAQLNQVRRMQKESVRILTRIAAATDEVGNAAGGLSRMSEESAEGARQQQSAVSSIASAIEQMVASVNEIEQQAESTRNISERASHLANDGENVVKAVEQEMLTMANSVELSSRQVADLGERSRQVGNIIHVIEEISDQTNLLALNAAIEAARAGEAGRGFAVVADEVRTLAGRTRKAAEEVAEQIQKIQTDIDNTVSGMETVSSSVSQSVEMTHRAGDALRNIKDGAEETEKMIVTMSAAVNEQGAVSQDIAHHIENINQQAHQQNTIIEDVALASGYLVQLSQRMEEAIGENRDPSA